jgi:hemoglobin
MEDVGGDPACWAHRFDDERRDIATRRDVELLVRTFYRAAAMDDMLGPVFRAARVAGPGHIAVVSEFWMGQLFGRAQYEGNPLRAHVPVDRRTPLTGAHFDRWLELLEETVDELFDGAAADRAKARAAKMARALPRLLRGRPDLGSSPIEVRWSR